MPKKRGLLLKKGEEWSVEFPEYIYKGGNLYRKPVPKINSMGFTVFVSRYYLLKKCDRCGKNALVDRSNEKKSRFSYCSLKCRYDAQKKPDGTKTYKRGSFGGHIMIKCENHPYANNLGRVAEHRLVIEKSIGRYLKPTEQVHHINLQKDDNRLENLVLFQSHSDHFKAHGTLNKCVAILMSKGFLSYDKTKNSYEVT